jgi:hypothetical protein
MTESKKEWRKPELIVIVRSKPEEAVLCGCKDSKGKSGAINSQKTCMGVVSCEGTCNIVNDT